KVRGLPQGHMNEEHRQQLEQALALLDRADSLRVETRAIHLRRAHYLKLRSDERSAAEQKEVAQRMAASTATALDHLLVGQEHYSSGEVRQAYEEFHRALLINDRHFWARYFLGICCVALEMPAEAEAHFTCCQGQRPELIWIYLLRGYARGQIKEYEAAEN